MMKKKYMMPPRHPRCGCIISYSRPEWDYAADALASDIRWMKDSGIDYNAAVDRFAKEGDAEVRNRENWRSRLQWENNIIRQLFPQGSR